jgi:hypothetical protein
MEVFMENKLCFVAKRTDGLGERMRAFVNALALSQVYDAEFKFFWDSRSDYNENFHAIGEKESFFSQSFIEKHHVELADIQGAKPIESFFENFDDGIYFCNQDIPRYLFKGKDDVFFKFRKALSRAFDYINFTDSINSVFDFVNQIELSNSTVALHLRAGDMVYGPYKSSLGWLNKVITFPVASKLIDEAVGSGKCVLIFGQDAELINFFIKKENVLSASEFVPHGLGRIERAFFDISLMGRCCSIYGGSSGFSLLSSIIGNTNFIRHYSCYSNSESTNIILNELRASPSVTGISDPQKIFACKVAYVNGGNDLSEKDCEKLFSLGKELDPTDVFFNFIECWYFIKNGQIEKAETIAEDIVIHKKENFLTFVKLNFNTPHTTSVFLKLFNINEITNLPRQFPFVLDIYTMLVTVRNARG